MSLADTLESLGTLGAAAIAAVDAAKAHTGAPDEGRYAHAAAAAWADYKGALAAAEQQHPDVCFACEMRADQCPCRNG